MLVRRRQYRPAIEIGSGWPFGVEHLQRYAPAASRKLRRSHFHRGIEPEQREFRPRGVAGRLRSWLMSKLNPAQAALPGIDFVCQRPGRATAWGPSEVLYFPSARALPNQIRGPSDISDAAIPNPRIVVAQQQRSQLNQNATLSG